MATLLSKRGRRVLLLEASRFPRYHIGESLIPGAIPVLRELGVWTTIDRYGFTIKRGNAYVWGQDRQPWSIAFAEAGTEIYTYQVMRSEFDKLLLDNARASGVDVREQTKVTEVEMDTDLCCTRVRFAGLNGEISEVRPTWMVDATGQAALIGTQLGIKRTDSLLNNVALWSYFEGAERLPEPESGYTLSASTPDGWVWHIPLHDDSASVGVVLGVEALQRRRKDGLDSLYEKEVAKSEVVSRLIGGAKRRSSIRTARDWSYLCGRLAGPNWVLVGDAAGFVDPILATGCGIALQAASAAAEAIDLALAGADKATVMRAYESFYRDYIGQFFDFVHYFYDGNRHLDSYFWQARRLVDPKRSKSARSAFIHLVSGLHNSVADAGPKQRSFEMGVFDNLGTPLGAGVVAALKNKQ